MNKFLTLALSSTLLLASGCQATTAQYKTQKLAETDTPIVSKTNLNIQLDGLETLNHEPVPLSKLCGVHKPQQELGTALQDFLIEMDANNSLEDAADVTVSIVSARSTFRCYLTSPLTGNCESMLKTTGNIKKKGKAKKDFETYSEGKSMTVSCEGVGKSLVQAGQKFISEITSKIQ